MELHQHLLDLVRALNAAGIEHALCGGLALAIHAVPRATRDIDLLTPKESIEAAVAVARDTLSYELDNGVIPFPASGMRIYRVTKILDELLLPLDLIEVTPAIASVWESRFETEWGGERLCVVSREGLIAMKRIAGRPQDLVDIAQLEASSSGR